MSKQTVEWLNNNVKIGNVHDKAKWANNGWMIDDKPWFDRGNFHGAYDGFVPVDDVLAELFYWDAVEVPLYYDLACSADVATDMAEDGTPMRKVMSTRKVIVRSDNGFEMGVFKDGYRIHQFDAWLLDHVSNIIDDHELGIDSAGLLDGGSNAWVSITLPEEIMVNDTGFTIRPALVAVTSHNGTYASSYNLRELVPVCDNSLAASLRGVGSSIKVKHTKNSELRIANVREALSIMYQATDEMQAEIDALCKWEVSNGDFGALLDVLDPVPLPKMDGTKITNQRSINSVVKKRGELNTMWVDDPRVSPWQGTALGVLQAFNTHHLWVRNANEGDGGGIIARNFGEMVKGTQDHDMSVIDALCKVQGRDVKSLVPA